MTDQLGSPRVIVNSLGAIVSRRDFMPFGEELDADETYRKTLHKYGQTDSVRQKFTGYQNDTETGLDFAEARMYHNLHGRFTAVDPLLASGKSGNPQTFNRYVYVLNSPLVFTDPTGLQVASWTGAVYTNGRTFGPEPFIGENSWAVEGAGLRFVDASDGYSYSYNQSGSTLLGRTADLDAWMRPPQRSDISILAESVNFGVDAGFKGILKGVGNAPVVGLNGVTGTLANHGAGRFFFQGSNPFEVPLPFGASNPLEASYMSGSSTGTLLGAGLAGGTIYGASSRLSVVPESSSVRASSLTRFYPENNGFLGATERTYLMPGDQISRYGSTSGRFFSPSGTPLSMRSLPPNANTSIHNNYTVLKPFEVEAGRVAPAFGQPGLGTQFRSPVPVDVLLKRGIIGQP